MSKEILRKKLLNLRKKKFKDKGITFIQFKKILKKMNFKNNINIGGYYPINSETGCLDILENLEKKKFKISLPVIKKKITWTFINGLLKTHLK